MLWRRYLRIKRNLRRRISLCRFTSVLIFSLLPIKLVILWRAPTGRRWIILLVHVLSLHQPRFKCFSLNYTWCAILQIQQKLLSLRFLLKARPLVVLCVYCYSCRRKRLNLSQATPPLTVTRLGKSPLAAPFWWGLLSSPQTWRGETKATCGCL